MAESIKLKLELTKESIRFLNKFPIQFKKSLHKGFNLAMKKAEQESKLSFGKTGKPSVRTGNLRRSIQSRVITQGGDLVGQLWSDVIYAATIELGDSTRNIKDYPYLRPAIEDNISTLEKIIGDEIERGYKAI